MELISPTITCPKCGTEIPLTKTIPAPLIEQARLEGEAKLRQALDAGVDKKSVVHRK